MTSISTPEAQDLLPVWRNTMDFLPLKLDVKRLSCLSELCKSNNSSKLSEILLAEMKRGAARENTKVRNLTLSISTLKHRYSKQVRQTLFVHYME